MYVPRKGGLTIMKNMYRINVKSYITKSNIYKENDFRNDVDGSYIFNKEEIDSVVETVKNQIQDNINTNDWYGGVDDNVPTNIEISADGCELHMRAYISFSCEKVDVMTVVDFIQE